MTTDEVRELAKRLRKVPAVDTKQAAAILERLADDKLLWDHRLMTAEGYRNVILMGED